MIIQLGFVIPTGVIVLFAFIYLKQVDRSRTAAAWAWAWVWLYSAGITVALVPIWEGFMSLSIVANTMFVGFIYSGSLAFAQREKPWVIPVCTLVGVLRGALFFAGYEGSSLALGLFPVLVMSVASVAVVWRAAADRETTAAERMLAPVLAVNAALTAVAPIVPVLRLNTLPLVVLWANVGVMLVFLQLTAAHERRRQTQAQLLDETQRQAQTLEQERIMLEALIDAVPAGIMLVDGNAIVRNMNRLGAENFKLGEPARWLGRPSLEVFEAIIPRLSADSVNRIESEIERGNREFSYAEKGSEIRLLEPEDRSFLLYSRPVLSENGAERIGEAWVSWDVTEQRRLTERLQHAKRMETLGTLSGGVAHDFNNQLTPILGYASLIADELPADHRLQRAASNLQAAAEHCAALTDDLLAVAQRAPSRPQPVDPGVIINDVANLLGPSPESGVDLSVEIAPETRPLRADPIQLKRVISNLLVNARDAVGMQGQIALRARNAATGSGLDGDWVEIEVQDDGEGMDGATRDHVFDPFFTTKSQGRGTGLGLSIVYGIVELHGATIEVESQPGQGACFRLLWPAAEEAEQRDEPAILAGAPTRGDETVLLVDDEERVRHLARDSLELHGYRVIEARDSEEAMRVYLANAGEIDLAIVDFTMPGRDGAQLIEALREQTPSLPAILMSGYLERTGVGGPQVDASFLAKPFLPAQLAALARRTLDERPQ